MRNFFVRTFLISILSASVLFFVFPKFFVDLFYEKRAVVAPIVDTVAYDKKLEELANNPTPPSLPLSGEEHLISPDKGEYKGVQGGEDAGKKNLWPVKTPYPNAGAILPFNRIVAYYGNLYSAKMGILGQYPEEEMLAKLNEEVKKWEIADPETPVVPALHYIAVVAQSVPGKDGKYRMRMPDSEIDKVLAIAEKIDAIVFLDVQVGFSDLQTEVPLLEKYLKMPQVHLGLDPEFSMKNEMKPGKSIGTFDASDINFAADYLAEIVKANNLPPKVLVIHRFTGKMVTNFKEIKPLPEVQIVMNMDGFGRKFLKIDTYKKFIYLEPVQFAGFKLFYQSDIKTPGTVLMTPEDLLKLTPQPIYIQYQ